jgi:hypothetical protein
VLQDVPHRDEIELLAALVVHGVTQAIEVPATVSIEGERLTAAGEAVLRQTDFGIKPFSAALGTVRVKNEVRIRFTIVARRVSSGSGGRRPAAGGRRDAASAARGRFSTRAPQVRGQRGPPRTVLSRSSGPARRAYRPIRMGTRDHRHGPHVSNALNRAPRRSRRSSASSTTLRFGTAPGTIPRMMSSFSLWARPSTLARRT